MPHRVVHNRKVFHKRYLFRTADQLSQNILNCVIFAVVIDSSKYNKLLSLQYGMSNMTDALFFVDVSIFYSLGCMAKLKARNAQLVILKSETE